MEKTNTRSSDRFAFPGSGWIVLLMLASALVGAAAGHFYGAAQPAAAAQVAAPVLTQAEPAVSAATGPVPNVAQSGISDETELRQEINAMRQERKSDRPTAVRLGARPSECSVNLIAARASGRLSRAAMAGCG